MKLDIKQLNKERDTSMTPAMKLATRRYGDRDILNIPLRMVPADIRKAVLMLNALPYAETKGIPTKRKADIKGHGAEGAEFLSTIQHAASIIKGVTAMQRGNVLTVVCATKEAEQEFWQMLAEKIVVPAYLMEKKREFDETSELPKI